MSAPSRRARLRGGRCTPERVVANGAARRTKFRRTSCPRVPSWMPARIASGSPPSSRMIGARAVDVSPHDVGVELGVELHAVHARADAEGGDGVARGRREDLGAGGQAA